MLLAKLKPTNSTAKVLLETEAAAKEDGLFDEYIFEPYLFAQSISNNKRLVRRLYIARYRYDGGYQSYFGYTPDHTQDKTDAFIEIDTNKLPEDKWQTIEKARQAIDDALIKTTRRPHPTNTY
jgi:hypothetical protein